MSKNLLHKTKLNDFRNWLIAKGFEVRDGRGAYQVLQVNTRRGWQVVYERDYMPEHYTVVKPLEALTHQFIKETRNELQTDAQRGRVHHRPDQAQLSADRKPEA